MNFSGKYIDGTGDFDYLELIDQSFDMFHPTRGLSNISTKISYDALLLRKKMEISFDKINFSINKVNSANKNE